MIHPITNSAPVCYGVCCPKHGQCQRYAAVENASGDVPVIATCEQDGERELFVPTVATEVA